MRTIGLILFLVAPTISVEACENPIVLMLNEINEKSLYARLGFQSQDQIIAVNGKEICQTHEFNQALSRIKDGVDIQVLRNGKMETIRYEL